MTETAGKSAPARIERGLVMTSGGYVHYRAAGKGPPVLLLHINQQSSAMYLGLLQVLAPGFRAIAMDYPGCGMSDHIEGDKTLTDYANTIVEVLDGLGMDKVRVIGEAVSSVVATELAVRYPERVEAMVLMSYPFTPAEHEDDHGGEIPRNTRPADPSGFPMTRTLDFVLANDPEHAPMHPTQDWMDRINLAQAEVGRDRWQLYAALLAYDFRGALPRIACPVKILMGEHFYFSKYREQLVKAIPGSSLDVIPGGRFCMGWEFPAEVGHRAGEFFKAAAKR